MCDGDNNGIALAVWVGIPPCLNCSNYRSIDWLLDDWLGMLRAVGMCVAALLLVLLLFLGPYNNNVATTTTKSCSIFICRLIQKDIFLKLLHSRCVSIQVSQPAISAGLRWKTLCHKKKTKTCNNWAWQCNCWKMLLREIFCFCRNATTSSSSSSSWLQCYLNSLKSFLPQIWSFQIKLEDVFCQLL